MASSTTLTDEVSISTTTFRYIVYINGEATCYDATETNARLIIDSLANKRMEELRKELPNSKVLREEKGKTTIVVNTQALGSLWNGDVIPDSTYSYLCIPRAIVSILPDDEEEVEIDGDEDDE